jgi:glycosidase
VEDGSTPLYRPEDSGRADFDLWCRAGGGWQGGTLQGLKSKLGYLRRLGITALWVSPIFRQVAFEPSYHGYGIQNFLDVDPHFGTHEEFREFVQAAHARGIYVILDIIAHHTGTVFSYDEDRYTTHNPATGHWYNDPRWDASLTTSVASITAPVSRRYSSTAGRPQTPWRRRAPTARATAGLTCPSAGRTATWYPTDYKDIAIKQ